MVEVIFVEVPMDTLQVLPQLQHILHLTKIDIHTAMDLMEITHQLTKIAIITILTQAMTMVSLQQVLVSPV